MNKDQMISSLRRGKNGQQILDILNSFFEEKVEELTDNLPDPGYIITWDGRQVAF